jgi:hypothetical protein
MSHIGERATDDGRGGAGQDEFEGQRQVLASADAMHRGESRNQQAERPGSGKDHDTISLTTSLPLS